MDSMSKKIIGLIPTRLHSTRLPQKSLLQINNLPLIIHTYKRAKLSKSLSEVVICCDDKKVLKIAKKYGAKAFLTSKHHKNGTERVYEGLNKLNKKFDLVVDVQGDEPLISPYHIDQVVNYHLKNLKYDIILPSLKIKNVNNTNIIKVIKNKFNEVIYLSRGNIPFEFKELKKNIDKHLSIISFKPEALEKFAKHKKTNLEKIEDIELLRAIEIGLKIKSPVLSGDSFSVDVMNDYEKAKKAMKTDKYFKLYKS